MLIWECPTDLGKHLEEQKAAGKGSEQKPPVWVEKAFPAVINLQEALSAKGGLPPCA